MPDRLRLSRLAFVVLWATLASAQDGPLREYSVGGVRSGRSVREPASSVREGSAGPVRSGPVRFSSSGSMRSGPLSEASSGPVREPFSEASAGEPPGVGSAGSVKKASAEPPRARIGQTFGDLEELQELLRERARASAGATKEQGVEREPVENEAPGSLRAAAPAVPEFPPAEEPSTVEARSAEMLVAPPENTLSPRGVETGREEVPGELSAP